MKVLRTELRRLRHTNELKHSLRLRRGCSNGIQLSSLSGEPFASPYDVLYQSSKCQHFHSFERILTTPQFSRTFVKYYSTLQHASVEDDEPSHQDISTRGLEDVDADVANGGFEEEVSLQWLKFQFDTRHAQFPDKPPHDHKDLRRYVHEHTVTAAHILHSRALVLLFRSFLDSDSLIIRVQACKTAAHLVYRLGTELGLLKWRFGDKTSPEKSFFYLVKEHNTAYTSELTHQITDLSSLFDDALDDTLRLLADDKNSLSANQVLLHNHWSILLKFSQHEAEAMPSLFIQLQDQENEVRAEDSQRDAPVKRLIMSNNFYDNPITLEASENSSGKFEKIDFAEMIVKFCQQLQKRAITASSASLRFGPVPGLLTPGEFLQKAASVLGYGNLIFHLDNDVVLSKATGLDFWRSEISFDKQPNIKTSASWLDRKPARTLNAMRACIDIRPRLEEAYNTKMITPQEYQYFAKHWGQHNTTTPNPQSGTSEQQVSVSISVADETIARMLRALGDLRDGGFIQFDSGIFDPDIYQKKRSQSSRLGKMTWLDLKLQRDRFERKQNSLSTSRQNLLPLMQEEISNKILGSIKRNHVTIITAATGSGKTTQIPQLLWDRQIDHYRGSMSSIICTQPRRVSTISVARRVAFERQQDIGEEVGYCVRFDDKSPAYRRGINYMTSGLLVRILEGDHQRLLESVSHIILDEVHARDIDTDLILTALKNLMNHSVENKLKLPKIVLMSATIDAVYFADYFRDVAVPTKVGCLNIPGATYPVLSQRLDDVLPVLELQNPKEWTHLLQNKQLSSYLQTQCSRFSDGGDDDLKVPTADTDVPASDVGELDDLYVPTPLIRPMIDYILSKPESGDILVFLPGLSEIEETEGSLLHSSSPSHTFSDSNSFRIFKLHSALYETNFDVFQPVPLGCRRIVLATNIAETSLTLPDVKFVIDTGLSRQNFYEQASQSGQLRLVWISKAEVAQRRGRVGRTQPGEYFALYSDEQYESMVDQPQPELTRTSLDQIVLRVQESSAFHTKPKSELPSNDAETSKPGIILLTAPSAPDKAKILAAGKQLENLRAITKSGEVTALGKTLSTIPCSPSEAKAILLGAIFRCLDPLVYFGASLEDFRIIANATSTNAISSVRKALARTSYDDNIADARAFFQYDRARRAHNVQQVSLLRNELLIRHDTYRETSQASNQIVQTLTHMLNKDGDTNNADAAEPTAPYLFPKTSSLLNANSSQVELVKAMAMSTAGSRLAVWRGKDWIAPNYSRILPLPRSVNHTTTKRAVREQRLTREHGDMLIYNVLRIIPKDKYPWACDTSIVLPMAGILFAESVRLVDDTKLLINNWATYNISTPSGKIDHIAKIIMEYRKAIDRFLNLALEKISLRPHELTKVINGEMKTEDFNVYLREEDHPHRKIIVDSVVTILSIEAKCRAERLEIRRLDVEGSDQPFATADKPDDEGIVASPIGKSDSESGASTSSPGGMERGKPEEPARWSQMINEAQ